MMLLWVPLIAQKYKIMPNFNQINYSPEVFSGSGSLDNPDQQIENQSPNVLNKLNEDTYKPEDKVQKTPDKRGANANYSKEYLSEMFNSYWLINKGLYGDSLEKKELMDYLEAEVFPYFKVTLRDEEYYKQNIENDSKIDSNIKRINIESFKNTRTQLAEFFTVSSIYGGIKVKQKNKLFAETRLSKEMQLIKSEITELMNIIDKRDSVALDKALEDIVSSYKEETISEVANKLINTLEGASQILQKQYGQNGDKRKLEYFSLLLNKQKERENQRQNLEEQIQKGNLIDIDIDYYTDNGFGTLKKDLEWVIYHIHKALDDFKEQDINLEQMMNITSDNKKKNLNIIQIHNLSVKLKDFAVSHLPDLIKMEEVSRAPKENISILLDEGITKILDKPIPYIGQEQLLRNVSDNGLYHSLFYLISNTMGDKVREKAISAQDQIEADQESQKIFYKNKERYTKKFDKKLVFQLLKQQQELVNKQNYICTNRDFKSLEKILDTGYIYPTLELIKMREKDPLYWGELELKGNAIHPQEMDFGFERGTPLVYGTFIGGRQTVNFNEFKRGGTGGGYGDVFFLIKPINLKDRIFFYFEGHNKDYFSFSLEHISIIKSILNIKRALPGLVLEPITTLNDNPQIEPYIVAVIKGAINLEEVDDINIFIPKNDAYKKMQEIENFKNQYPLFREKIKITK